MLETKIEELIAALNANTAALLGNASTKKTPAPKAEATDKPAPKTDTVIQTPQNSGKTEFAEKSAPKEPAMPATPGVDEFRALAQKLLDAKKRSAIDAINTKHGLKRVTEACGTAKAEAVFAELKLAADECAAA